MSATKKTKKQKTSFEIRLKRAKLKCQSLNRDSDQCVTLDDLVQQDDEEGRGADR